MSNICLIKKLIDCHLHIIDPNYPLIPNNGYIPAKFTVDDYRERTKSINIFGGVVVSGSFQGFDQTYLIAALKLLGPNFVGVTQLPHTVMDQEIVRLNESGVRAIRFNLKRGGSESVEHIETFAKRVYEIAGWHVELYVDSIDLGPLESVLLKLPLVSIDHMGLSQDGFKTLISLVERGIKVKATGFGRLNLDLHKAIKLITSINPDALMFGTDLPSTRATRPFLDEDINLINNILAGDSNLIDKVFHLNASKFYRLNI